MTMVKRRTMVSRSTFRNLPSGALYWVATALNAGPLVKVGRRLVATGFSTDHLTTATSSDTSAAVVRVPKFLV